MHLKFKSMKYANVKGKHGLHTLHIESITGCAYTIEITTKNVALFFCTICTISHSHTMQTSVETQYSHIVSSAIQ